MGTYNGERYLHAQLASLARQSDLPGELVVCDDGSTDGTPAVLERFAGDAPFPVRVHQNPRNLGFADNFLQAASLCRGPLIAFCDQDDVWHEDKLARCRAALAAQPSTQLVIHSGLPVDDDMRPVAPAYPAIPATRVRSCLVPDWSFPVPGAFMVFRARLLALADWRRRPRSMYSPEHRDYHDQWVFFLATVSGDVALLRDQLVLYRQHGGNAVGSLLQSAPARVRRALAVGAGDYGSMVTHLEDCAAVLQELAAEDPGGRYAAAAEAHRRLAERFSLRRRMYDANRPAPERLAAAGRLVAARSYGRRCTGGLGLDALVKDAALLVASGLGAARPRSARR